MVDDEKVVRDGCSRLLSSEGYCVLTAEHGGEALDLLSSEKVDVILCDLKMPVMGALDVLEVVCARYPELPLIIITGHGTVHDAVECMKAGAYDFITKPFRADHLSLVVRRALEKQALARRTRELQEAQDRNLYDLATEQSRTRTIVNCMADGVLVTNRDLRVVLCNPAMVRLLGLQSPLPQSAAVADYIDDEPLLEGLRRVMENSEESAGLISRELSIKDLVLRALSAPIYGIDQEVIGSVTVFHDITTLKQVDRMKTDFLHMVSHELRSPLAAVRQQIAVILEGLAGELTSKQRELLSRSENKIQSLLELINDLLDLARIESGCNVWEQVVMDLSEVLLSTVALMRARAESRGVELALDLPDELPRIHADSRSMEEVFTNLISNAINYSPDGGRVTISAVPFGSFLEIRVSDSGIGIEKEEIPKIFEKFYRIKHPRTRHVTGTGLGLSIVKSIIDCHRGSVEVESEIGSGTTFRIALPVASQLKALQ